MGLPLYHVDAFSDRPFAGNPAAVCLLDHPADETWMQHLAGEMNLSETAFVWPAADGFGLRWFTPSAEVKLCGHATLASAHVLWECSRLAPTQPARFHTKSGLLTVTRGPSGMDMDFPATPAEPAEVPPDLVLALGTPVEEAGRNGMDWLVRLGSEAAVRGVRPDLTRLATLPVRGVIVTGRASTPGFDFVSRFFAPAVGVPEDPVTGSAHCTLGPFWQRRLGKDDFRAYQASARGGVVGVRVRGNRVLLSGQAVTVCRGELA
jgi:PhzF family phenazine biosynthesis protein